MIAYNNAIATRIFRDMADAVFVISYDGGNIIYVNEKCQKALGFSCEPCEGKVQKYADLMSADEDPRNDEFHQLILDAVYDRNHLQHKEVPYYRNGEKRVYNLRSSFLRDEQGEEPLGIVAVLTDITEIVQLREKKQSSNMVFALFSGFVCVITLMVKFIKDSGFSISNSRITMLIEVLALVLMVLLVKLLRIDVREMGLRRDNLKPALLRSSVITVILAAILIGAKLVFQKLNPGHYETGEPFISLLPIGSYVQYVATAFIQEFIARGVVQSSLKRIFDGKRGELVALIISSLVFGAIHLHYSFEFMLLASFMAGALGIVFNKQQNIWGVTMLHYVLGMLALSLKII